MRRKIGAIFMALVLAVGFTAAQPQTTSATCAGGTFYGNGSGTGGSFVLCYSGSGVLNLHAISNGSQTCEGALGFDNGTWDDCFSSLYVQGLTGNQRICAWKNQGYNGAWLKVGNGQYGFGSFQWPYTPYSNGSNADDSITSIKPCTA